MIIKEIAERKKVAPAQIALAGLLHKGDNIVPIPGTKQIKYLEENTAAAKLSLSKAHIHELHESLPSGMTSGQRYEDSHMALIIDSIYIEI